MTSVVVETAPTLDAVRQAPHVTHPRTPRTDHSGSGTDYVNKNRDGGENMLKGDEIIFWEVVILRRQREP